MSEADDQQSRSPYNEPTLNQAGPEASPSEGVLRAASPPPFQWEDWYTAVGGRTISIADVNALLKQIHQDQYMRFEGEAAPERYEFTSPQEAAAHLKEKALEFGADIVGICKIEPSDVYRGKTVTEKYAIAVGQRMRYCDCTWPIHFGQVMK